MPCNQVRAFRARIPTFTCKPGCHDCCGPVLATPREVAWLPVVDEQRRQAAEETLTCPYIGPNGCTVYADRPLICRLFGTTPRLPCPEGCRPPQPVEPEIEVQIFDYMRRTRQVLI